MGERLFEEFSPPELVSNGDSSGLVEGWRIEWKPPVRFLERGGGSRGRSYFGVTVCGCGGARCRCRLCRSVRDGRQPGLFLVSELLHLRSRLARRSGLVRPLQSSAYLFCLSSAIVNRNMM